MAKAFTGNIKDNDTEWKSAVAEYLKAKKLQEKAEMRVQVTKDILLELAGGTPTKGCGILVNSSNRNGTVQYAQIVKDYEKELIKAGLKISAYTGKASVVWSVSADKSL
jgi:hypothetical protein